MAYLSCHLDVCQCLHATTIALAWQDQLVGEPIHFSRVSVITASNPTICSKCLIFVSFSGFGTGVALSAVFIAVQASVDKSQVAPAISALYLASGFGTVVGLAAVSATFQAGLKSTLQARLLGMHLSQELRSEVYYLLKLFSADNLTNCDQDFRKGTG